MLEERRASSGKEVLEFHINDNTKISVKCLGSVVGRLKDIIKYHTVVKVISAHHSHKLLVFGHGSGHILMCIVAGLLAAATGLFLICLTKNLLSGLLCPFICSAQHVVAVAHAPGLSYDR